MQIEGWNFPEQLWYTREHLWLKIEDLVATVGLTDYAQDTRGDVLYLGLPREGLPVSRGDSVASIETGKWVGRICSPVSGTIVEVNQRLSAEPQLINRSPYEEGWIYRIKLIESGETEGFLQGEEFNAWLAGEIQAAGALD